MVDLSEFRDTRDLRCVIGRSFDNLSDGDAEKLEAAILEATISSRAIAKWMIHKGIKTSSTSVQTHRSKECRCG
jgi:hypothetical protein